MLSSSAFQALSNADLYQLYTEVYKKMEDKDEIIKNYVTASNEFLSKAVPKKHRSLQVSPKLLKKLDRFKLSILKKNKET